MNKEDNFSHIPYMTVVFDKNYKIINIINSIENSLLHYTTDELIGKSANTLNGGNNIINKKAFDRIADIVYKTDKNNKRYFFDYEIITRDGKLTYKVCFTDKREDGSININIINVDIDLIFNSSHNFQSYREHILNNSYPISFYVSKKRNDIEWENIYFSEGIKKIYSSERVVDSINWNNNLEIFFNDEALKSDSLIKRNICVWDEDKYLNHLFEVTKIKIVDDDNNEFILTILNDISAFKEENIQLRRELNIINSIYKSLPTQMNLFNSDGYLIGVNDENEKAPLLNEEKLKTNLAIKASGHIPFDYDVERDIFIDYITNDNSTKREYSVERVNEIIFYKDLDRWSEFIKKLRNGIDEQLSVIVRCKFKSYRDYRTVSLYCTASEKDIDGKVMKYIGFKADITKWAQLSEDNQNSHRLINDMNIFLDTILQHIPVGLSIKEAATGRYLKINKLYALMHHMDKKDIEGKTTREAYTQKEAESILEINKRTIELTGKVNKVRRLYNYQNVNHIVEIQQKLIRTSDKMGYIVTVLNDVTEREKVMIELRDAKERAEKSDKLKSAFLANMSHEIRTPLNAIVGFSELIGQAENDDERQQYSEIISRNSDLLLCLINDILDISKIDAGYIKFHRTRIDLAEYINEIALTFKERIGKKDIKLIVDNPYKHLFVDLDLNRFSQVMNNYMSNAIKCTEKGYIKIGYRIKDNGIEGYVTDTGIGIAEGDKSKIFSRFEKLNEFAQGSGLGLSITKGILEAVGGKAYFKSKLGEGSTFYVWRPFEKIEMEGK